MGYSLQQLSLFEHPELEKLIHNDRWDEDVLSRAEQQLQELPDDVLSGYRRSRVISGDLNQNDARSRQSMTDILQSQVLTTLEAAGRNDEVCTRMWKHIEKLALEGNVALGPSIVRFTRGDGVSMNGPPKMLCAAWQVNQRLMPPQWPQEFGGGSETSLERLPQFWSN